MNHIHPTVYLLKTDVTNSKEAFNDYNQLKKLVCTSDKSVFLYYKKSISLQPKWFSYLNSDFNLSKDDFFNAHSCAIVIIKTNNRYFAIPFGMGSHQIDSTTIEYNFGIKVALNCILNNELRQVDLTTPETYSQKTKRQSIKNSSPEEMGINKQKDILRGLVGKLPSGHKLGNRIEGKDSIRICKKIKSISELKKLCNELLDYSNSTTYKKKYPWIDNIAIVHDPVLVDQLNENLITNIKSNNCDNMFITTPILIDDLFMYEGFVFKGDGGRKKECYPFPEITNMIECYGQKFINKLDKNLLKKKCKVYLRNDENKDLFGWPLNRCISWETEIDNFKYILSDGEWFKVDNNFYNDINSFFTKRVNDKMELPNAKQNYGRESEYNYYACKSINHYFLFDLGHRSSKNKHIGNDQNEICDIYDTKNKRFIHVKPGKNSSDISHLIRQGVFSAKLLRKEASERAKFRDYLIGYGCKNDVIKEPFVPSEFTISFALILGKNQRKDIPFFSKVSFKDAVESDLEVLNYKCEFGFIDCL